MAQLQRHACSACEHEFDVHRHTVTVPNRGSLNCPRCDTPCLSWHGPEFFTVAVTPPSSSHDIPVIDDADSSSSSNGI